MAEAGPSIKIELSDIKPAPDFSPSESDRYWVFVLMLTVLTSPLLYNLLER